MDRPEAPASRLPARVGAAVWFVWLGLAVALTLRPFLWHLGYFQHPGAKFLPLFLAALLAAALALPLYGRIRRSGFWRYEPALLAAAPVLAGLFYEPRATLVSAWICLTCYAAGRLLRRKLGLQPAGFAEELSLSAGIGFGVLTCVLFVMGLCGWYYAGAFALLLGAMDLLAYREFQGAWLALGGLHRAWGETTEARGWLGVLLTAFAACFTLCGTMVILAPSLAFDVLYTHLPAAQFYAVRHSWQPLPFQPYANFPQGMEVLMTLGYSLGGQAAAQMLPPVFFVLALLMAIPPARACGSDRFSAVAGIVFAASIPFLHWTGSVAKNDLAVAFFLLAGLDCYLRWKDSGSFGWIRLGVFFVAIGAGVKFTAVFGMVPLGLLYLYAAWRQPRWLRAVASLAAVFAVFGLFWPARSLALSGNLLDPLKMHMALSGTGKRLGAGWQAQALRFVRMPWTLHFQGQRHFESPSPNPLGIFFVLFAPAWLLAHRRWGNSSERACILFCGLGLLSWAALVSWPRAAIAPLILLAVLTARRLLEFSAGSARIVRGSIHAAAAYCLLFALPVAMIIEINAPQLRLFTRQIDKPGYLREALATFGALEFLSRSRIGEDAVFALNNCSTAYAPDPSRFECHFARDPALAGGEVLEKLGRRDYRWLVLPSNPLGLSVSRSVVAAKHSTEVYRDANFTVYRLGAP